MNIDFVLYKDLKTITEICSDTVNEEFVSLPADGDSVIGRYVSDLNEKNFSDIIRIRKTVFNLLQKADKKIKGTDPSLQLMVVYGYRSLENQKKYFDAEFMKAKPLFDNEDDLYEYVHEKIAVPSVAGHPTGGAVDIVIFDMSKGEIIDFGAQVHDFETDKIYAFAEVSPEARANRMLLREALMEQGFAPYDGEWWHFSYGDKEWAFYYKKSAALYSQVSTDLVYNF